MPLYRPSVLRLFSALVLLGALAGCAESPIKKEASYPTRERGSDAIIYSDKGPRATVWGDGETIGSKIFGGDKEDKSSGGASGIGVNSFLWRAALDTVAFMPVASADPFGGVILTDWYENPDKPGERFKLNIYILDRQLRADAVRVAVFKQEREKKKDAWRDAKVPAQTGTDIENTILTRARELRVAQLGAGK
jgi:hypothetical protein